MTEIVRATNEQDCTPDDGNAAEEFEAIAVTLLRAAEAVRKQDRAVYHAMLNTSIGDEAVVQMILSSVKTYDARAIA